MKEKIEIVKEMVSYGYCLASETPEQFAKRFRLEQLKFFRDCLRFFGQE